MKYILSIALLFVAQVTLQAQTCEELIEFVKEEGYETTYSSPTSTAISKVSFYEVTIDYDDYYFAIVCFKKKYSYSCSEYIYQIDAQTKYNYSISYLKNAGKAFWKYIEPFSGVLSCSPSLD